MIGKSRPTTPRTRHGVSARMRTSIVVAAAGTLALGLAGCGSDDASSAATTPAADATTVTVSDTQTSSPSTDAATPDTSDMDHAGSTMEPTDTTATSDVPDAPIANAITITSPGMSYEVSGPLRPGNAAITFTNASPEAHMMAVARLNPGVTLEQVTAALGQSEDAVGPLMADGPDNSVYGTPAPVGSGESTTVTAMDLKAGNYALVCFFTDASGTPHFQMGMVNMLTVEGEPATEVPTSDGTITIDDSGIVMPDGFNGHGTFLVTNEATTEQSVSFARLDDGTTLDDYFQFVGGAMNGGTAIDGGGGVLAGGVDALLPGQSAYLTLALSPGHYGYVSTVAATGPTMPVQHGEFEVS